MISHTSNSWLGGWIKLLVEQTNFSGHTEKKFGYTDEGQIAKTLHYTMLIYVNVKYHVVPDD